VHMRIHTCFRQVLGYGSNIICELRCHIRTSVPGGLTGGPTCLAEARFRVEQRLQSASEFDRI
jgi:hypothetical protein